jgi:hypothetical protein
VVIVNAGSDFNVVEHNFIGTDKTGTATNLANAFYGIHVNGGAGTDIFLNQIAYNGTNGTRAGVRIEGSTATDNTISQNSIHDNSGKGIELVAGGNAGLMTPSVTKANCETVEGTTGSGWTIEVFSDSGDEGRSYEGTATAHAILPAFAWNGTATGPNVTVTATDGQGNTSEFSSAYNLACTAPTVCFAVNPAQGPVETVFTFDATCSHDAEDPDTALSVRWDWEDDGTYDTAFSGDLQATHSYAAEGDYTVRLEVRDSSGLTGTTTHKVTVGPAAADHVTFLPIVVRGF